MVLLRLAEPVRIHVLIVGLPYESLKLHFYVFCSWSVLWYLCVVGLKVGLHKLVNWCNAFRKNLNHSLYRLTLANKRHYLYFRVHNLAFGIDIRHLLKSKGSPDLYLFSALRVFPRDLSLGPYYLPYILHQFLTSPIHTMFNNINMLMTLSSS